MSVFGAAFGAPFGSPSRAPPYGVVGERPLVPRHPAVAERISAAAESRVAAAAASAARLNAKGLAENQSGYRNELRKDPVDPSTMPSNSSVPCMATNRENKLKLFNLLNAEDSGLSTEIDDKPMTSSEYCLLYNYLVGLFFRDIKRGGGYEKLKGYDVTILDREVIEQYFILFKNQAKVLRLIESVFSKGFDDSIADLITAMTDISIVSVKENYIFLKISSILGKALAPYIRLNITDSNRANTFLKLVGEYILSAVDYDDPPSIYDIDTELTALEARLPPLPPAPPVNSPIIRPLVPLEGSYKDTYMILVKGTTFPQTPEYIDGNIAKLIDLIHKDETYDYDEFLPKLTKLVFSGTDEAKDNIRFLKGRRTNSELKSFLNEVHSQNIAAALYTQLVKDTGKEDMPIHDKIKDFFIDTLLKNGEISVKVDGRRLEVAITNPRLFKNLRMNLFKPGNFYIPFTSSKMNSGAIKAFYEESSLGGGRRTHRKKRRTHRKRRTHKKRRHTRARK